VLARYMQILSADFLDEVGVPVINIHHSFLPAFIGAGPYQRAKERGAKRVGATAHYVTEDLDEGPIIEQDVIRVSHRDSVRDLQRKGADVDRLPLDGAVRWAREGRGNRGPIIEQDVIRVSHRDSVRDLQRKGADVERLVLARAVKWHCEDRVIRDGNTTVVF